MVKRFGQFYTLFRQSYGRYKSQIILLGAFGFLSGLLEGIGVNALIPLFSFALGDPASDLISKEIIKFFALIGLPYTVRFMLVFIAVLFSGKALLTILLDYLRFKIITDYEKETRRNLFEKILASSWTHLMRQKLGYLEIILTVDVPNAATLLGQIGSGITVITGLAIYIFVAINISARITLTTLFLGGVIFLVFQPLLKRIKILAIERNQLIKDTAHHVSENILGVKAVKSMRVEHEVAQKGERLFDQLRRSTLRVPFLKSIMNSVMEPVAVIFVSFIFALTYRNPDFNLAMLIAIVYLINRIFLYIQQLMAITHTISSFSPYLTSVVNYQADASNHQDTVSGGIPFQFEKDLRFQNMSFAYTADRPVLTDVNLTLKKGQLSGLIGPSGVGKTTLVDLILRLLEPTSGQILLDGTPYQKIRIDDWRKNIGYMAQDFFLLNDTIANNIRFYSEQITDEGVESAARMANIHEFIMELPQRYETVIGERGVRLSVGERQRVVLARVLARQPQLLILDEATSALDNESEAQIQKTINDLHGKVTVLIVAHRLSTVANVDQLIVLDAGHIVEADTPETLLTKKGSYYARLLNLSELRN